MFHSACTVALVVIIGMVSGSARLNSPNHCRPKVCECRSIIQSFPNGDKITSAIKTAITAEVKKATDTLDTLSKMTRAILAAIKSPYQRRPTGKHQGKGKGKGKHEGKGKGKGNGKGKGTGKVGKFTDCAALYKKGIKKSGVYQIGPFLYGTRPKKMVSVYCDMKTDGGGWTVFQRRFNGHVEFYRNWAAYATGFGNAKGEYWLGNDIIHALTEHRPSDLRVDLVDWKGKKAYAKYGVFSVAGSKLKYKLQVGMYSGTAGDSLVHQNSGQAFSTPDKDNDKYSGNCAYVRHGAWWYNHFCEHSNLNGHYYHSGVTTEFGLYWYNWYKKHVSLKRSEMKVRPHSFKFG